jgi:hypothetical protein
MLKLQVYIMIAMIATFTATIVSAAFILPSAFASQLPGCSGNPHVDGGPGNPHDKGGEKGGPGNPHEAEGKGNECPGTHSFG